MEHLLEMGADVTAQIGWARKMFGEKGALSRCLFSCFILCHTIYVLQRDCPVPRKKVHSFTGRKKECFLV